MDEKVAQLIDLALREDIGSGDVTSRYFVSEQRMGRAFLVARSEGVVSGVEIGEEVFRRVDSDCEVKVMLQNGASVFPGSRILEVSGRARSLLTAERTAINFVQRLSGVATRTSMFVKAVEGTGVTIMDTRKTTPGWRLLEKQAVVSGGGQNHRMGLYDRAMVKDNHLLVKGAAADLPNSIQFMKKDHPEVAVQLEADTLQQVEAFIGMNEVDYLLLDNMDNDTLRKAVAIRGDRERPVLEASGGVNLETVRGIAETGVDCISVGELTHSASALDLALDFVPFQKTF
ncbi:MAG: nicotinate-nucleotide diphosphorylase (carboxylating) [Roseibacillus sp.]|nr:nicotinate-nucleotide diphosphorylase (carboxylating) [Roseibacillus sp.]